MLIFTRKINESVVISDEIIFKILDINRGQVRIGIDAPKKIPVHREEIYKKLILEGRSQLHNKGE